MLLIFFTSRAPSKCSDVPLDHHLSSTNILGMLSAARSPPMLTFHRAPIGRTLRCRYCTKSACITCQARLCKFCLEEENRAGCDWSRRGAKVDAVKNFICFCIDMAPDQLGG
ncbi:uncharacterized protein ASCRUDRAFT_131133 [Ascoidea rubescens DSM 1968]|uniref:Uncharacterized protein n=1 Tax=Ascoidea rubescens DSM 1968 TaxID=1344418 RepID=A0A1D2V8D7_9ASCO|nr:hypothetical protein ASCRUDRAFT_131133 [Ascoidea rubescens DSM 1968]ODV57919.1 hypothetical protein ASCRUDRAFT_131133 [Ascoidea rubescens DSM 1968]